jgi:hypothetical protein
LLFISSLLGWFGPPRVFRPAGAFPRVPLRRELVFTTNVTLSLSATVVTLSLAATSGLGTLVDVSTSSLTYLSVRATRGVAMRSSSKN